MLQRLRVNKNLSLREASRLLHISPSYLCKIEGGFVPSDDVISALGNLYGIDMFSHYGRLDPVLVDKVMSHPELLRLIREYV